MVGAAERALTAHGGLAHDFIDVFMATAPGLRGPRRAVPSPALA
jgi:hypothetical protein